jgi:sporulation protein YqfC
MKLMNRLDNYLYDKEYRIIIKENYVNIVNYDEIVDFNLNKISVKYRNKKVSIKGTNLTINKMVEDEVLITGNISNISIN